MDSSDLLQDISDHEQFIEQLGGILERFHAEGRRVELVQQVIDLQKAELAKLREISN